MPASRMRRNDQAHHAGRPLDLLLSPLPTLAARLHGRAFVGTAWQSIITHLSVKIFQPLAAGVLVAVSCACGAPASPTAPTDAATAAVFQPDFYRAFLQNAFEAPHRLEPIRLLRGSLRVYVQTHDNSGRAVDAITLDTTERTVVETVRVWSGDTFGVIGIVRGSGTRESVPGWITVKWSGDPPAGSCGRSTVGVDGGYIELNVSGACSCGMAARAYPRLIRHELGHAMGYYHTDHPDDVMYGRPITTSQCDAMPSERERHHAALAHTLTHFSY